MFRPDSSFHTGKPSSAGHTLQPEGLLGALARGVPRRTEAQAQPAPARPRARRERRLHSQPLSSLHHSAAHRNQTVSKAPLGSLCPGFSSSLPSPRMHFSHVSLGPVSSLIPQPLPSRAPRPTWLRYSFSSSHRPPRATAKQAGSVRKLSWKVGGSATLCKKAPAAPS